MQTTATPGPGDWCIFDDEEEADEALQQRTRLQRTGEALLRLATFAEVDGSCVLTLRRPRGGTAEVRLLTADGQLAASPGMRALARSGASEAKEEGDALDALLAARGEKGQDTRHWELDHACCDVVGASGMRLDGLLVPVGGGFLDLHTGNDQQQDERTILHRSVRSIGGLSLVLTLEALPGGRGHAVCLYHPPTATSYELTMPTRDGACPEKFCAARATFAGVPLVMVFIEAAFPHSVRLVVREPRSEEEFRIQVRDEDPFAMLTQAQRKLLARCTEELLRHGVVGEGGSGSQGFMEMPRGPLGAVGVDTVPVVRAPRLADKAGGPTSSAGAEDDHGLLVFSASFAVAHDKQLCVSLARARDGEDFAVGLQEPDTTGSMHLLQLRAPGQAPATPAGGNELGINLFAEVRDVGGVSLLVVAFLDVEPRALRLAIVESGTGRSFRAVVLLGSLEDDAPPFPDFNSARLEVLDVCRRSGLIAPSMPPPPPPRLALASIPEKPVPALPDTVAPGAAAGANASVPALSASVHRAPALLAPEERTPGGRVLAPRKASRLFHRQMRKLPSGQPVLLSVVQEQVIAGSSSRFAVLIYHPVTAKEFRLTLPAVLLDRALAACGLGNSMTATAEAIEGKRKELAAQVLSFVYVHADGHEIEFRTPA